MDDLTYDVIVVGSGHAGCEAALAAARMGCRTAVFTLNLDTIALMPCNPSIGGPGKAHLAREIDALGGEMARNADRTSLQIRMLNTSKGPAVQALRVQSDKRAYSQSMKSVMEAQDGLHVKQAAVDDIIVESDGGMASARGVITSSGTVYRSRTVVLTTGTFLKGRIITGEESYPAGRAGEYPADKLSDSLLRCGFQLGRLKTGTPPRIDGRSIDLSAVQAQPGSVEPLFFSFDARNAFRDGRMAAPSSLAPIADFVTHVPPSPAEKWREQMECHVVQTNESTHEVIRQNLDRAPMYNGGITSSGPRYCPSIETKIVRFADKTSHHLFLEPEGWRTREFYVQGANTSLPEDVQLSMLRTIPALRYVEIMRAGYAIEYDYLPGTQVHRSLEAKLMRDLFLAGQIIGTTGYEEAASLGLVAGINAARRAQGRHSIVLRRDQAYIGVLIDDLTTKEMDEPYRMHTSQAEFRLLLRQDNAEDRLSDLAYAIGTIDYSRMSEVSSRRQQVEAIVLSLRNMWISPGEATDAILREAGCEPVQHAVCARDFVCRSDVKLGILQRLNMISENIVPEVLREAETVVKYAGYVSRQEAEVKRLHRLEDRTIPETVDYASIQGMRSESRERLARVRPLTVGQAGRVAGVAPSDVSVLLVHLEREQRLASSR
ncbi:MAG: tRNA uridine-5-carboxymethylaminomethyl(34) synthesis enzyme MnmG [Chloroflexota bacterium]